MGYGGNGSGKSNFYYALEFARRLIVKSKVSEDDSIDIEHFRLDEKYETQPSKFAFEVLVGDEVFKYSFAVSRRRVLSESLEILKGEKTTLVYSRSAEKEDDKWNLDYFEKLNLPKEEAEFVRFKARDTLPNQLFLNAVRGRKIPVKQPLRNWFHLGMTRNLRTGMKLTFGEKNSQLADFVNNKVVLFVICEILSLKSTLHLFLTLFAAPSGAKSL